MVLAFRDCRAAPPDEFFSAQIEIDISEATASEEDGATMFDLHDSFSARVSAGSERTDHRRNLGSVWSRDG
jgi:hypothetical protein